ncbi:MAG: chemotaxis protein CheD [Treponemataceae bacterium]
MFAHKLSQFSQPITIIHPGEFLASSDDIIISTVLGSCVSVALRDAKEGIGGLNHFMLPGYFDDRSHFESQSAKYGMYAMELLINDLLDLGCRKDRLRAKVFGGGSVLGRGAERSNKVPKSNIDFAFDYLKTEGIPVECSDTGGNAARKILFFVRDGKVLLKRITGTFIRAVDIEERDYLDRIKKRQAAAGDVTLF